MLWECASGNYNCNIIAPVCACVCVVCVLHATTYTYTQWRDPAATVKGKKIGPRTPPRTRMDLSHRRFSGPRMYQCKTCGSQENSLR
jgi:hypothetical protein